MATFQLVYQVNASIVLCPIVTFVLLKEYVPYVLVIWQFPKMAIVSHVMWVIACNVLQILHVHNACMDIICLTIHAFYAHIHAQAVQIQGSAWPVHHLLAEQL